MDVEVRAGATVNYIAPFQSILQGKSTSSLISSAATRYEKEEFQIPTSLISKRH